MTERVLVREERRQEKPVLAPNPEAGWRMVALAGLVLGAIGWLDLLLLWFPPHFGRPEWEFGTVSATFDALPLGTLGLALLLAAVMASGWRGRLQALMWFAFGVLVVLLAALVLYGLDLPLAWKGVAPETLPMLKRAIAKTLVLAVAYLGAYGLFGVIAWRRWRTAGLPPRGQGAQQ